MFTAMTTSAQWGAWLQGFGMCGGLIVAIGAQNAFLLGQAVRREHHYAVAALCLLFDVLLIGIGVAGAGGLVAMYPAAASVATWLGAGFVFWYGLGALRSAVRGGSLRAGREEGLSLKRALLITTVVTLLNPQAWLDTVVLIGSLSGTFEGGARWAFGVGAVSASAVWFLTLSAGGARLAPLFRRPGAWRVLDGTICLVMWGIAFSLVRGQLAG
ncbi:MAG: LysE/ArgO family amino acid transporter [Desulfovibrio sp.]|jgi:L-lysine exporter family protein LysE/ArgO